MRTYRAALLSVTGFVVAVSSIGCEAPHNPREPYYYYQQPDPRYLPRPNYVAPPPPSPPATIPETMPGTPGPSPMPSKSPVNLGGGVPTLPTPSNGPTILPPGSTSAPTVPPATARPLASGIPPIKLLDPPVAIDDNKIPRAIIDEVHGVGPNGEKIPGHRYDDSGREIKPGAPPAGVIPLGPGTDLPPLPTNPPPRLLPKFRPELTASAAV